MCLKSMLVLVDRQRSWVLQHLLCKLGEVEMRLWGRRQHFEISPSRIQPPLFQRISQNFSNAQKELMGVGERQAH